MVFKLVRTDSEDPCKIQLTRGTHLLGRGKFLDCEDKRVSRNHGELEVTDDAISIKALHSNPCFYIKKGTSETQILKQNNTVDLSHGDQFGLLPNSYWYELLHCSELDIGRSPERSSEENTEPFLDQPVIKTEPIENINGSEHTTDCDMNETVVLPQRQEYQSLIDPVRAEAGSPSLIPRDMSPVRQEANSAMTPPETTDDPPTPAKRDDSGNLRSLSPKRSHSTEESKDEAKKIKLEPDGQEVKPEPDVTPGPSGDQSASSNNIPGLPPSPVKPVGRERCIYGGSCYRKNPQHKAQFAHPSDPDWGPGERGECPYGARCVRRDPRHWRHHAHPPGVTAPAPAPPGMQVVQRRGNIFYINAHSVNFYDDHFQVEDSDGDTQRQRKKRDRRSESQSSEGNDSPQASLIVTGKRIRKTIRRPSYSGSEFEDDEEDPFGTDEEDEWVPNTQSQYTQDTQDDD